MRRAEELLIESKVTAAWGVVTVPKQSKDDTLIQIEATQAALRQSIDQAKTLADESDRLVRKYRAELAQTDPPNPA